MSEQVSMIRLEKNRAQVQIGGRTFFVSERNSQGDDSFCPVELVVAALGS
jgi:hypothetical protein